MKKIILMALIGGMIILMCNNADPQKESYVINNNTVYFNDSRIYLTATPHTIYSSDWVYFNLTSKIYSGNIDVVWGFNTTQTKPTKAQLYRPHNITWNTTNYLFVFNVSSISHTTASCDYGNEYNTYKRNVTYSKVVWGNEENDTSIYNITSNVFCFDSYEQEGNNYTIYWHTTHIKLENWVDFSDFLNSIDYNFGGMNKWWYIKNISIVVNKTYQVRGYIKVPISFERNSGKYWIALKPSDETIQQAIANNHLYYIDPWWNSSFNKCKNITITNTGSTTLTNFPAYINLTYDSDMQSDYDDIRFVNTSCNNGGSELDYEIENYTTASVHCWVEIDSLPTPSKVISVYYNNSGASSGENPTGVWDENYLGVWHMNEVDVNDSTSNNHDGTQIGGVASSSNGAVGRCTFFDETDDQIQVSDFLYGPEFTWEFWYNDDNWTGPLYEYPISHGTYNAQPSFNVFIREDQLNNPGNLAVRLRDSDDAGSTTIDGLGTNATLMDGEWHHYVIFTDTGVGTKNYIDGKLNGSDTEGGDGFDVATPIYFGSRADNNSDRYYGGYLDEIRLSNVTRSPDWINQTYQLIFNQGSYVTLGTEQSGVTPSNLTYQENPNATYCLGSWDTTYTCANVYDGNWGTYGYGAFGVGVYLYVNYSIQTGTQNNSLWQIKDSGATINLTIPASCLAESTLQFEVHTDADPIAITRWSCKNSTAWTILRTNDAGYNVYEEAMWWNITAPADSCTYSSGNWNIDLSDNCVITTNTDIGGNDLLLTGSGTCVFKANITGISKFYTEDWVYIKHPNRIMK